MIRFVWFGLTDISIHALREESDLATTQFDYNPI